MRRKGPTDEFVREYDTIERQWEKACIYAESKCGKRYDHKYPFTTDLNNAGTVFQYWKVRLSCCLNGLVLPEHLQQIQLDQHIDDDGRSDEEFIRERYTAALAAVRKCQRDSKQKRDEMLDKMAEEEAQKGNTTKEMELRKIQAAERVRELYSSTTYILNKYKDGAITCLKVPDPSDPNCGNPKKCKKWIEVDQEEMYETLRKANRENFRKCDGTPFANTELGYLITLPRVRKAILEGTFDIEAHTDDYLTQELLRSMRHTPESRVAKPLPIKFSSAEFRNKIRTTKERKSGSPCGIHQGMDRAIAEDDELVDFRCAIESLPFEYGFAPEVWKDMVEPMLEKEEGKPHLGRLRQLALIDGRYARGLKIIYSDRLMQQGEKLNLCGNGQIGGRKGHQAIQGVIRSMLVNEYHRLLLIPYVSVDYDAKACFDRLVTPLTAIFMERAGLRQTVSECNNTILNEARRRVKTAQGLSKPYDGRGELMYGHGQGKADAGVAQTFLTHGAFGVHAANTRGVTMRRTDRKYCIRQSMMGFVDDVKAGLTSPTKYRGRPNEVESIYNVFISPNLRRSPSIFKIPSRKRLLSSHLVDYTFYLDILRPRN